MTETLSPESIPHRPPFLFVDDIVEVQERRILTRKLADPEADFFRGHYPPANDTDLPAEKLERILDAQVVFLNRYLDLVEDGVDWVAEIAGVV